MVWPWPFANEYLSKLSNYVSQFFMVTLLFLLFVYLLLMICDTLVLLQEPVRIEAAHCLGILCHYMSDESLTDILQTTLLKVHGSKEWSTLQAQAKALSFVILSDYLRITQLGFQEKLLIGIVAYAKSDRVIIMCLFIVIKLVIHFPY